MTHRYLCPAWWVERLSSEAERVISPRFTMPLLAWAARRAGEPEIRQLYRWVRRGTVALDIGANRGTYCWHMQRLGAGVHAFEANPELAERLARALPGVRVHACALSDREGEIELRVPIVNGVVYDGWASTEPENRFASLAAAEFRSVRVPCRTLDSFDFAGVEFIKIDVEGHELAVLRGAEQTIRRCWPLILFEADDHHRRGADITTRAFLAELGYRVMPAASTAMWLGHVATTKGRPGWRS